MPDVIVFHPQVKLVHVLAVPLSGTLFARHRAGAPSNGVAASGPVDTAARRSRAAGLARAVARDAPLHALEMRVQQLRS
jgi:hypothetical protein